MSGYPVAVILLKQDSYNGEDALNLCIGLSFNNLNTSHDKTENHIMPKSNRNIRLLYRISLRQDIFC